MPFSKHILFFTIFISCCLTLEAQTVRRIDGSEVDRMVLAEKIADLVYRGKVHGLTISVITKDSVLYQEAFGSKNLNESVPLQTSHGFYAASLSKPLFAYIVMKLVDKGQIDLDKPLVDYLDKPLTEYSFAESYEGYEDLKNDPRHKNITARMCLSHTSGLPNWRYIGKFGINFNKELTIESDPGTYYSYSGEGIYLLQFVVEQITGRGLEDLAREHVFEPFDMHHTSFVWQDDFEEIRVRGHYKKKKVLPVKKRMSANAAGSMETTPEDYARFIQAMINGDDLSEKSFEEMINAQVKIVSRQQFGSGRLEKTDADRDIDLSYGLGWGIYQTPHGKAVFKEGHILGWEHYTIFYPGSDLGVVIMTNSAKGEGIFKELLEVVAADTWMPWYWEGYIPYD